MRSLKTIIVLLLTLLFLSCATQERKYDVSQNYQLKRIEQVNVGEPIDVSLGSKYTDKRKISETKAGMFT